MKSNQTLVAAGVLLVLIFLYFMTQTGAVDTKTVDPEVLAFQRDDVASIQVITPTENYDFKMAGPHWILNDYPVDTSRMSDFLAVMSELTADRIITRNPEKYAKYEVDEQGTRYSFKFGDNDEIMGLIIGKQGANYQETAIKRADKQPVYAVLTNLSRYRDFKTRDFWDKAVTDLKVDRIKEVSFEGNTTYRLTREGPVWSYNGEQVDFEKVQNLLKSLENLRASNFIENIEADKDLYQRIMIRMEDGEQIDLKFYLKDEKASVVLLSASNRSKDFEYPKSGLNRFQKNFEDLKSEPVES